MDEDYTHEQRMAEIQSIRERIRRLRAKLDYNSAQQEELQELPKVVEQQPVVDETRERKNAELDAIKAKLMGKKK